MDLLKERIRREGKVLPGNIIKVDGFLNHRVDTKLMAAMAEEFEKHFDVSKATVVLTAEASGIALATMCAYRYGLPLIYAKKATFTPIHTKKRSLLWFPPSGSSPRTRF